MFVLAVSEQQGDRYSDIAVSTKSVAMAYLIEEFTKTQYEAA